MNANQFPAPIQTQIDTLVRISSSKGFKVGIEEASRGADFPSPLDRFVVRIPYCGVHLKWGVVFNAADLTNPPDLIPFVDEIDDKAPSREIDAYANFSEIGATLLGWNIESADALFQIIIKIRMLYQKEQSRRVLQLPAQAVVFQYESFLQYFNGLECLVTPPTSSGNISVRFVVPLLNIDDNELEQEQTQAQEQQVNRSLTEHAQLDFSQKPPVMVVGPNDSKECVLVSISYTIDYSEQQATPRFHVTFPQSMPVCKQSFRQPQWNSASDIVSYLPQLQRSWLKPWHERLNFFSALCKRFALLELDYVDCRQCMLLAKGGTTKKSAQVSQRLQGQQLNQIHTQLTQIHIITLTAV
jgi:hypothetical protein